jgi:hypothetical protein
MDMFLRLGEIPLFPILQTFCQSCKGGPFSPNAQISARGLADLSVETLLDMGCQRERLREGVMT